MFEEGWEREGGWVNGVGWGGSGLGGVGWSGDGVEWRVGG